MSRQNKMSNKRRRHVKHAILDNATHKAAATGARGSRTTRLHRKLQQYPKTILLGKWLWRWVD